MSNSPGLQQLSIPSKQMGQMETMSSSMAPQQLAIPGKLTSHIEPRSSNLVSPHLLANKRPAQMEPMFSNLMAHQLSAPKRTVQIGSTASKPGSQQLPIPNKRTAQMEPSPKGQSESFESVRSKLRESLASALALVSQKNNKVSDVGTTSQNEAANTPRQAHEGSQPAESSTTIGTGSQHIPERHLETLPSQDFSSQKHDGGQNSSQGVSSNENVENALKNWEVEGPEFQLKHVFSEEDTSFSNSFLIKDELLQGNGLYWATDLDVEVSKAMECHSAKRPKLEHEKECRDGVKQTFLSPETLAFKIESELFKLFGGVNKKYKEKGRSLLFNLKDRNNPELRERVMSGEITPERLCSMTAEELASKELSQWRIAKAEELAQMVVLPDSHVDIRRLVKKTHKGEFQVEVEQNDSVSVEVAVGASSLSPILHKTNEANAQLPSKPSVTETSEVAVESDKSIQEDKTLPSSISALSHDGTDYMQGFMVDELRDAEFLPPIVSLDEFMESLDSEPPFENIQVDAGQYGNISGEKKSSGAGTRLDFPSLGSTDPVDTAPNKLEEMNAKSTRIDSNVKSSDIHIDTGTSSPGAATKGEHVWEGILQLNFSTMVTVVGLFKSGEKTSAKEWPRFLEIKGRVRLNAFEKFLQDLRMSRSRAIMVVQFCWKEGSPENGRVNLCEVADSYVMDERVGFAELPGVELYFCPPHTRTVEMLGKILTKDQSETLGSTDTGLIGVVVWKKAQAISPTSPNSSGHHKHSSKKQHLASRKQQEKDANANLNANASSKPPLPLGPPPTNPEPPPDDDPIDDVPPGFGPAAARDEDDLPEFDFVRGTNLPFSQFSALKKPPHGSGMAPFPSPQPPPRPVEQMRQLVHKYGQGQAGSNPVNWQHRHGGLEVHPWDDDDIPEWQPQPSQQPLPPPVHNFQQPLLPQHQHMVNVNQQHPLSGQPQQPSSVHPSQPVNPLAGQQMPFLRPSMNMMPSQVHQTVAPPPPTWQHGVWWTPPSGTGGSQGHAAQANGVRQPCHFGGQPVEGQLHGTPSYGAAQNSMDWRQDASRGRGF
ncbi:PREDICTED: uncharacterized protein LOC104595259 [Nelumbo nucifera]|uniref:Uncharacterized protein LOC104595259 n=2 Tax=Nelumbo nucifera TaxID=4432 RepID=A0A1U7ZJR9_NELNU|nr:PREDICTED: uncharacterized protein LOC104595259 [Nelumbo nucifera]DAD27004.1 TPA_asm: hypothetical protein HUJ06_028472 [Nelumbo nucifera]